MLLMMPGYILRYHRWLRIDAGLLSAANQGDPSSINHHLFAGNYYVSCMSWST